VICRRGEGERGASPDITLIADGPFRTIRPVIDCANSVDATVPRLHFGADADIGSQLRNPFRVSVLQSVPDYGRESCFFLLALPSVLIELGHWRIMRRLHGRLRWRRRRCATLMLADAVGIAVGVLLAIGPRRFRGCARRAYKGGE
jgi:hypothetical protein